MSLILKGIDLPKASNEDCMVVIRSNGKVEVWQTGMKEFEAQAIQIPTPHGRLIDSEEILTPIYCIPKTIGLTDKAQMHLTDMIENAHAILESEGINEYHIERD